MATIQDTLARIVDVASGSGLRPNYPPVALDLEPHAISLVRFKPSRRGKPTLEAHLQRHADEALLPESIFESGTARREGLGARLQEVFEASGTRPGRVSLVLPDNLAKVSLITLPERPANMRQLEELIRAKMRRAVPFRLEESSLSFQLLPGEGREVSVFVILMHRAVIEHLEGVLDEAGARPGLVDLATPNLLNLARGEIERHGAGGADVALLNCADRYFSLAIVRRGRVIFFRCKTFAGGANGSAAPNGGLVREVGNSFSYYREKLGGEGIGTMLLRSTSLPLAEVTAKVETLDCGEVLPIDPTQELRLAAGVGLDAEAAQRLAPAIGAAIARNG